MAINIIDIIRGLITPDTLNTLASMLGEDKNRVATATSGAAPAILAGILGAVSKPAGASAFSTALSEQDPGLLDNLAGLLGGSQGRSQIESGSTLLSSLLGQSGLGGLIKAISGTSGLSAGSATSLLGALAPMVMGVLGREQRNAGLDTNGLLDMLRGQSGNIASAIPSTLASALGSTGLLDSIAGNLGAAASSASSTATAAAREVNRTAHQAASSSGSFLGKFLSLAAVAAVAWFGYQYMFKPDTTDNIKDVVAEIETITATNPPASINRLTLDSGIDLGSEISKVVSSTTDTLAGITSVKSAEDALPELMRINDELQNITGLATELSANGRSDLAGLVSGAMGDFMQLTDKVNTIPGVADILNPVMEPILKQLQILTQA